jgi:transcriptional regulator with XRE-family HTH domain
MKAANWIDQVKTRHGWTSDYRAAKELGLSSRTISAYRTRTPTLDDESAVKVATALGIDPAAVLADQAMERARSEPVRKAWLGILDKLQGATASILLTGCIGTIAALSGANSAQAATKNVANGHATQYTSYSKRRRKASWLTGLIPAI